MKPLFIPLRTEYYRQFDLGEKTVEYRAYGPRWNERTCCRGRAVTLSHGYSGARLSGVVTQFRIVPARIVPGALAIYAPDSILAVIHIALRD